MSDDEIKISNDKIEMSDEEIDMLCELMDDAMDEDQEMILPKPLARLLDGDFNETDKEWANKELKNPNIEPGGKEFFEWVLRNCEKGKKIL